MFISIFYGKIAHKKVSFFLLNILIDDNRISVSLKKGSEFKLN